MDKDVVRTALEEAAFVVSEPLSLWVVVDRRATGGGPPVPPVP